MGDVIEFRRRLPLIKLAEINSRVSSLTVSFDVEKYELWFNVVRNNKNTEQFALVLTDALKFFLDAANMLERLRSSNFVEQPRNAEYNSRV
jgi:hypothetical protein